MVEIILGKVLGGVLIAAGGFFAGFSLGKRKSCKQTARESTTDSFLKLLKH